jgi:DNA-binding transcriptional LysR family regulator
VALLVLVPRAVQRLQTKHPGVTVMLQESPHDMLLTSLLRGELDCVVGRLMSSAAPGPFVMEALYEEPICVVARPGHPLARSNRITAATLARQSWLLPPPGAPLRQRIDAYFVAEGLTIGAPVVESVSLLASEVFLRGSDMLGVMPRAIAQHYAIQGMLAILNFKPVWDLPWVGIAQRAGIEPLPVLQDFLQALRDEATDLRQ